MDLVEAKQRIEANNSETDGKNDVFLNIEGETPFVEARGFKDLEGIRHGFSSRFGGVSQGIFESMNLGLYLDDDRERVLENYRRFGSAVGVDYRNISCPNQQHHTNVLVVTAEDAGDGMVRELSHFDVDGQITNVAGVALIVYWADCVPILFADPKRRVIGAAHAGWRGTVAGISAKIVEKMGETYGCEPEDIRALIGPSIGVDNYEVDEGVISELRKCHFIKDFDGLYRRGVGKGKFMFDLQRTNEHILINSGLKVENIFNVNLCTMELHDIFFSHRYTKGKRGLNAGLIELN